VLPEAMAADPAETALISVLLLRGEQTIGELKSRSERQHAFDSIDDVAATLAGLAGRDGPLVRQLERQPGQKDARWVELLSAPSDPTSVESSAGAPATDRVAGDGGDPYAEATAEFYDLLATAHWDVFGLQLLDLLADVDATAGPIVDLGAGTGVGLPYLRAAVPGAAILAIEPSRAMRTALHTRLLLDDGLRRVTTVDPRPFATAGLPARACAVVVSAVLGHLDADDRTRLWRFVAERLPQGAPAVIEVLPPDRPVDVPMSKYRGLAVGEYVYEGWQRGEPVDDRNMAWTMEYRVRRGGEQIAVSTVRSVWTCVSIDDIRAEAAPFGLSVTQYDECAVVRR
jgi:hypothetical protein